MCAASRPSPLNSVPTMRAKQSSKSAPRKSPAAELVKAAKKKPDAKSKAAKSQPVVPAAKAAKSADGDGEKEAHGSPDAPCELSSEVMEFITAIDDYKRSNRRPFPSWSEVFKIVKALGYNR